LQSALVAACDPVRIFGVYTLPADWRLPPNTPGVKNQMHMQRLTQHQKIVPRPRHCGDAATTKLLARGGVK